MPIFRLSERLSEIARISPETFRHIQDKVTGGVIDIDGQRLPLTAENAPKLRAAIESLRARLRQSRAAATPAHGISDAYQAQTRLDLLVEELSELAKGRLAPGQRTAIRGVVNYAIMKLTNLSRSLEAGEP